jgi:hypothetical protein
VSNLAVLTGLDPHVVADLDEDEFHALTRAVEQREQSQSWTSVNEGLAAAVEALWAILARLNAGVPMVQAKRLAKPHDFGRFPRPEWVKGGGGKPKEIVVRSPAEAARMMRKG